MEHPVIGHFPQIPHEAAGTAVLYKIGIRLYIIPVAANSAGHFSGQNCLCHFPAKRSALHIRVSENKKTQRPRVPESHLRTVDLVKVYKKAVSSRELLIYFVCKV